MNGHDSIPRSDKSSETKSLNEFLLELLAAHPDAEIQASFDFSLLTGVSYNPQLNEIYISFETDD